MKVRNIKDKKWVSFDYRLYDKANELKLNIYSITVYALICCYVNKEQKWRVSIKTICKKLGISKDTVLRAIKVLVENKMVVKKKRAGENQNNVYCLVDNWLDYDRTRQTKDIKNFFWIDKPLLKSDIKVLKVSTIAVYIFLCRHPDKETQTTYPPLLKRNGEGICKRLSISKNTAIKAIRTLEYFNIIFTKKGTDGQNNTYTLINKSEWREDYTDEDLVEYVKIGRVLTKK